MRKLNDNGQIGLFLVIMLFVGIAFAVVSLVWGVLTFIGLAAFAYAIYRGYKMKNFEHPAIIILIIIGLVLIGVDAFTHLDIFTITNPLRTLGVNINV